jgi:hypothetical protein
MTLQVPVDDELIEEAKTAGRHASNAEAVSAALREYIARRRQQRILDLFGTIEYEADYDYKAQRQRA